MSGAALVMPVTSGAFSEELIPSIGRYAVIGCIASVVTCSLQVLTFKFLVVVAGCLIRIDVTVSSDGSAV